MVMGLIYPCDIISPSNRQGTESRGVVGFSLLGVTPPQSQINTQRLSLTSECPASTWPVSSQLF